MIRPCRLIHSSETAEQRHERLAMEYLQMAINRLAEAVDLSLTLTSAKVRVLFCRLHVCIIGHYFAYLLILIALLQLNDINEFEFYLICVIID